MENCNCIFSSLITFRDTLWKARHPRQRQRKEEKTRRKSGRDRKKCVCVCLALGKLTTDDGGERSSSRSIFYSVGNVVRRERTRARAHIQWRRRKVECSRIGFSV